MIASRISILSLCIACFGPPVCSAQEVVRHVEGGEFVLAERLLEQIPEVEQDPVLAQIAAAQSRSGESVAASDTIQQIRSPAARGQAIDAARGAGGGAFADFQSLMDLIQTTVVPDTWEALGGPSTMAPYPQGVYVDPEGTVLECETVAQGDAVADLKSLLSRRDAGAAHQPESWRNAARMRCVSLRRLLNHWTHSKIAGTPTPESMRHMAGLSRVQYVFLEGDDVIIAGPVGGVDSVQGWYRDRKKRTQHASTRLSERVPGFRDWKTFPSDARSTQRPRACKGRPNWVSVFEMTPFPSAKQPKKWSRLWGCNVSRFLERPATHRSDTSWWRPIAT